MTWNGTTVNDDIFTHNLTSLPMTHQQKCLRSLGIIHKCNMHITGATDNVSLIDRLYYEWLGSLSEMKWALRQKPSSFSVRILQDDLVLHFERFFRIPSLVCTNL